VVGRGGGGGGSGAAGEMAIVQAVSDAVRHGVTFDVVRALRAWWCMRVAACGRGWWRGRGAGRGVVRVRMREWGCVYVSGPIY
jgi:hypothetical protein